MLKGKYYGLKSLHLKENYFHFKISQEYERPSRILL